MPVTGHAKHKANVLMAATKASAARTGRAKSTVEASAMAATPNAIEAKEMAKSNAPGVDRAISALPGAAEGKGAGTIEHPMGSLNVRIQAPTNVAASGSSSKAGVVDTFPSEDAKSTATSDDITAVATELPTSANPTSISVSTSKDTDGPPHEDAGASVMVTSTSVSSNTSCREAHIIVKASVGLVW